MPNSLSEKHNPVILEHPSLNPFPLHLAFHGRKEVVIFRDDLPPASVDLPLDGCIIGISFFHYLYAATGRNLYLYPSERPDYIL